MWIAKVGRATTKYPKSTIVKVGKESSKLTKKRSSIKSKRIRLKKLRSKTFKNHLKAKHKINTQFHNCKNISQMRSVFSNLNTQMPIINIMKHILECNLSSITLKLNTQNKITQFHKLNTRRKRKLDHTRYLKYPIREDSVNLFKNTNVLVHKSTWKN